MNFKVSQKILLVMCLLSLASIVGFFLTQMQMFFYFVVGFFLIGFVQAYIWYRCPHCKKALLRHGRAVPQRCPHCHNEIH